MIAVGTAERAVDAVGTAEADVAVAAAEGIAEVAGPVQRKRVFEAANRHRRTRLVLARFTTVDEALGPDPPHQLIGVCVRVAATARERAVAGRKAAVECHAAATHFRRCRIVAGPEAVDLEDAARVRDVDHRHAALEAVEHVGELRRARFGGLERHAARHLLSEVSVSDRPEVEPGENRHRAGVDREDAARAHRRHDQRRIVSGDRRGIGRRERSGLRGTRTLEIGDRHRPAAAGRAGRGGDLVGEHSIAEIAQIDAAVTVDVLPTRRRRDDAVRVVACVGLRDEGTARARDRDPVLERPDASHGSDFGVRIGPEHEEIAIRIAGIDDDVLLLTGDVRVGGEGDEVQDAERALRVVVVLGRTDAGLGPVV